MTFVFPDVNLEVIPSFQDLDKEVIDSLYQIARIRVLLAGEVLYNQGDVASSIYAVQSGAVRLIQTTPEGKSVNLKVYSTGDVFSMLALSAGFEHSARVEATDNSQIICLHGQHIRNLMSVYPQLALLFIDKLIAHVHHAHERIRTLAVERTEQRVARALVHFCHKFGTQVDDVWEITIPLSQQDIAEFTGTTPETVNRIMRSWERDAIIYRSRKQTTILKIDVLQSIIDVSLQGMAAAIGD